MSLRVKSTNTKQCNKTVSSLFRLGVDVGNNDIHHEENPPIAPLLEDAIQAIDTFRNDNLPNQIGPPVLFRGIDNHEWRGLLEDAASDPPPHWSCRLHPGHTIENPWWRYEVVGRNENNVDRFYNCVSRLDHHANAWEYLHVSRGYLVNEGMDQS